VNPPTGTFLLFLRFGPYAALQVGFPGGHPYVSRRQVSKRIKNEPF
jgi:hypothetical protein